MPALLDDPTSPTIYRQSGAAPFPDASTPLPASIVAKPVTLRDRTTKATLVPFGSADRVPLSLVEYLCAQMNSEIERGDTYPMTAPFSVEAFGRYWFQNFAAIMVLGDVAEDGQGALWRWEAEGAGWDKLCLGSFYIKPNYPGRSSHVCNAGFVVTDGARNRGVGKLMGECYLEWAPLLGYTYSVFNLVYETNVASCRIWDSLGFKRIGRVPGCGNLKTQPEGHFVDAIIYGRHLGYNKEDADDERRFERIKYYLLTGKYPGDADSAEKNRLRAAVRNYTLVELGDDDDSIKAAAARPPTGISSISTDAGTRRVKLMLGDKEVISDPRQQYEIARQFHRSGGIISNNNNGSNHINKNGGGNSNNDNNAGSHHAGINKTTANVSVKYHWNRIKGTVTDVIENCAECGEKVRKKAQLKSATTVSSSSAATAAGGGGGGGSRIAAPLPAYKAAASPPTIATLSAGGAGGDAQQHPLYASFDGVGAFASSAASDPCSPSAAAASSMAQIGQHASHPAPNGFSPASKTAVIEPDPALPPPLHPPIASSSSSSTTHGPFGHEHHSDYPFQHHRHHQHQEQGGDTQPFFCGADSHPYAHHHQFNQAHDYRPPGTSPPPPQQPAPHDVDAQLAHALAHDLARDDAAVNERGRGEASEQQLGLENEQDYSSMALDPSILEAQPPRPRGERGGLE
ncbi:uncharacterized protein IWZ02DRAFT_144122 [Phyllosticta citriasiana]|uniref:N-acetyltransferase domain-containing protein n=1 Tax=Phyllosticta citriasiana TaxID=595635 RepID=A0ABR1KTD0_9PEZI